MIFLHIGGVLRHFPDYIPLLFSLKSKYKFLRFIGYDSFKDLQQSGGRINYFASDYDIEKLELLRKTNLFDSFNIQLGNFYYIKEEIDLIKQRLTDILLFFDKVYVTLSNEYLLSKLKQFFGNNIVAICSITRVQLSSIECDRKDSLMYKRLEKIFDLIVPRCEHVFQENFIKSVNLNKYIIMINDTCKYACPYWKSHFKVYHKLNVSHKWKLFNKQQIYKFHECWLKDFNPYEENHQERCIYGDKYGMDLTAKQIKELIEHGVKHFKISGRELTSSRFTQELKDQLQKFETAFQTTRRS